MSEYASETDAAENANFVQSFARGLAIIRAFDADHPTLTLTEAARRAGVSPAAARRLLHTLEALGYVRSSDRSFTLTPRVLELGFHYLSALSLPERMQPHLARLSGEIGESVSAAVLEGPEIVYVARVQAKRIMTVGITLGTRFPAYATSMGRVLLAQLPHAELHQLLTERSLTALTPHTITDPDALLAEIDRVARQGWSLVDEELELGLRSIAAPVRDATGTVVAAVNLSMVRGPHTAAQACERMLPPLLATTAAIEADLRLG